MEAAKNVDDGSSKGGGIRGGDAKDGDYKVVGGDGEGVGETGIATTDVEGEGDEQDDECQEEEG